MRRPQLLIFLACASLLIACDPLTPEVTPKVIIVTRTPLPTSVPSATPQPTFTPTALPPTDVPPATAFACAEKKGQVLDLDLASKNANATIKYRVYLPPCYNESTRRYPYVILMPGADADETEWTTSLKADAAIEAGLSVQALPPMILVMTGGGDLMNLNSFPDSPSWENLIIGELMPEIEKNFCTWNAREGRAIGGISRGGFWAFEVAFRHPELFSAVGGHSPYFDPDNAPAAFNPLNLAKTVQFAPGQQPRLWLDIGKDDINRPNVEVLVKTLAGRKIDPNYTVNPAGDHSVDYWGAHVTEYLSFYGQTWPRSVTELPSCLQ